MMDDGGGRNAVIAGFTGAIACIATIVEGVPRQHRFTFIKDASASHAHQGKSEAAMHEVACSLISLYARVETTENWIYAQEDRQLSGVETHGSGEGAR